MFKTITLIAYYRPPEERNFNRDIEQELSASSNNPLIVTGDLNIDPIDKLQFPEMIDCYNFAITNAYQTRPASGKLINYAITNLHQIRPVYNFTVENGISDHCSVITFLRHSKPYTTNKTRQKIFAQK